MSQPTLRMADSELYRWAHALIDAVDRDNVAPPATCGQARTLALLEGAPASVWDQAGLAIGDFLTAADLPFGELRADSVCDRFVVHTDRLNVLVARMTVPGGPWPGHYGLEAVCFDAEHPTMPAWFPTTVSSRVGIDFGTVVVASRAFAQGSAAVLFPEQLSVRNRTDRQAFGVVFIDKLTELFLGRVAPLIGPGQLGLSGTDTEGARRLRRLAFLAHEWGHLTSASVEQTVLTRRRRLAAVISELNADLAAIVMLLASGAAPARSAALVLIFDRLVREAWLPRPYAQVDAIAARHLLRLLKRCQAIGLDRAGQLVVDLDTAATPLHRELQAVRRVASACTYADLEPARSYLGKLGWQFDGDNCHLGLSGPVVDALAEHSQARRSA